MLSQLFTTGSGSDRYRLQGIGIDIDGAVDSDGNPQVPDGPSSVSVAVHAVSGGKPGAKLFDLVSPDEFEAGHSFFEAPPGVFLEPGIAYALVWSYVRGTWHRLSKTLADSEDSDALSGFMIANSFSVGADIANLTADDNDDDMATNSNALEIAVYGEAGVARPVVAGGYPVSKYWLHIPDSVEVGDQFRLVFVTQARTDAISVNVEDYDAVVQAEAGWEYNNWIIRKVASEFKAVVCTAEVDARTRTEIAGAFHVPVHWLDGGWKDRPTLIANSYYEFYSPWVNRGGSSKWGAIATGNSTDFDEHSQIWTGCDAEGVARAEAHMGTTSNMGTVAVGAPNHETNPNHAPLGAVDVDDAVEIEKGEERRLYAISPVFTVVNWCLSDEDLLEYGGGGSGTEAYEFKHGHEARGTDKC